MQLPFARTVRLSGTYHGSTLDVSLFFLRRGGTISCEITGQRKYSRDLPQGGLEVPCVLTFKGDEKEIKKLMQLFTVKDQVSMQSL